MTAVLAGGRSSWLLGANGHAGKLALRNSRLAFRRGLGWSSHSSEGDHGRHKIGLAIDQTRKLFKHSQTNLAHLASRQVGFGSNKVDEFFEIQWDVAVPLTGVVV